MVYTGGLQGPVLYSCRHAAEGVALSQSDTVVAQPVWNAVLDAIERYNELVLQDPDLDEAGCAQLKAELVDKHAAFGSRPLCTVLRPNFITPSQHNLMAEVCAVLDSAGGKIRDWLLAHPDLWEDWGLSDQERTLAAIEPGYQHISITGRWDAFLTRGELHFVEFNAEAPTGIGYNDVLVDFFNRLSVMRTFNRRYWIRPFPCRYRLKDSLLSVYREWGGEHEPTIAIVDWTDLPTIHEFEILRHFFSARGHKTYVVDPRELEYRRGILSYNGDPIHLVYRRVLVNDCVKRQDDVATLVRAVQDGAVCMINSFRTALTHRKAFFSLLTDDETPVPFTAAEREVIQRHVPWTRRFREGMTIRKGNEVDLVDFVLRNRRQLVLKPNDDYGGHGVHLGWQCSTAEWEEAIAHALATDYVVQDRIPLSRGPFPIMDGSRRIETLLIDMDPFVFRSDLGGFLTRLSNSELANVTAGGGQVPTFVIEPKTW